MRITPGLRTTKRYQTEGGRCPFDEWFNSLRDTQGKANAAARIERAEKGGFGDHKVLGDGVFELRIDVGPGYRVYFGLEGDKFILLLLGGAKGSQSRDIERSKKYWADYVVRTKASERTSR